jgi:hypothetical protein
MFSGGEMLDVYCMFGGVGHVLVGFEKRDAWRDCWPSCCFQAWRIWVAFVQWLLRSGVIVKGLAR